MISGPQSRLLYRLIRLAEAEDVAAGMLEEADSISDVAATQTAAGRAALGPFPARQPPQRDIQPGRGCCFLFFLKVSAKEIVAWKFRSGWRKTLKALTRCRRPFCTTLGLRGIRMCCPRRISRSVCRSKLPPCCTNGLIWNSGWPPARLPLLPPSLP
ncbi:MAG: hypothetical protein MZV64_01780 [Ignavibacteriales bacterium]|nr:hypothetical protein [Ignavibacteriales bacterium]